MTIENRRSPTIRKKIQGNLKFSNIAELSGERD